jgi:hypothetical protein
LKNSRNKTARQKIKFRENIHTNHFLQTASTKKNEAFIITKKIMRTKKITIAILLLSVSTLLSAQLKVNTNGSVGMGYTGYANLNMGNQTTSEGYTGPLWGLEVWSGNLNLWRPWPSTNNGDANYYLFINPAGGVGIGKAPTQTGICLDVNGKIYSYGVEITSDERLKTDIKPLTDKLYKLYQLNGKSYKKHAIEEELTLPDIKDDKGNIVKKYEKSKRKNLQETSEFGFLAQELKDVYPELVRQDTLGYYYVNYIGLIPVLVEALKDQKAQINALTELVTKSNSGPKKVGANPSPATSTTEVDAISYPVLDQNIPNPFNTATTIGFSLPASTSTASVYVYDMNGVQLKSYPIAQRGKGNITIQGSEFNAGMYLYALIADGKNIDTKRMILTK